MIAKLRYFVVCKPAGILSQFTSDLGKGTLGDLFAFPRDVYPVGRLDELSEGLLIVTNDKQLNHRLLDPSFRHRRTYWVCTQGKMTSEAMEALRKGVQIKLKKTIHHTLPAEIETMEAPDLPERAVPFSYNAELGLHWVTLTLREGKNRQVRKMTASVGFPTLRLIRSAIEDLEIGTSRPGEVREYDRKELYSLLHLT